MRVALVLVALSLAAPARAQVDPAPPSERASAPAHPELSYDLRVDLPIVVGGYVTWSTLQSLNRQLAASDCHWCDEHVNGVDRRVRSALRWSSKRDLAMLLSDIGADTLTPAATVGLSAILAGFDGRFGSVPVDLIVTAEAVEAAGILTQVVKYSVGRLRPDAHDLPPEQRPHDRKGNDAYVSFWSGHTSYAFSLASAAGTVAWMRRYPGYEWIWVGGLSIATTTAYLRIAGDKHYFTDVLSAAVSGAAIGFCVPYFFHRPNRRQLSLRPSIRPLTGGAMILLDVF